MARLARDRSLVGDRIFMVIHIRPGKNFARNFHYHYCAGRKFEYFSLKPDHQLFLTLEITDFHIFVIDARQTTYTRHFACSKSQGT